MRFQSSLAIKAAIAIALMVIAGCAAVPEKEADQKGPLYWPPLPVQPRFVHEASLRGSYDIRGEEETEEQRLRRLTVGEEPNITLRKPMNVAARQGRIYVTDSEARVVYVFDVPRRKFFSMGFRFEGALRKPMGIAVDKDGKVYVADTSANRVVVYDALGLFERAIGGAAELQRPTAVAVNSSGDRIYVVDTGGVENDNHRVIIFDADGRKIGVIGGRGKEDGQFNLPTGAAVAPDGTLYVLDTGNFRVQAFTPDGQFLRKWGSVGNAFGQFARPRGIAVDNDGLVYVSDSGFANIQVFNASGQLLLPINTLDVKKDGPGHFALPAGLAVDESGRLYVVDQYFQKIEVIRRIPEQEGRSIMQGGNSTK